MGPQLAAALLACFCIARLPTVSSYGSAQPDSRWLWPHRGDVRAVITVTAAEGQAAAGGPLAAVVEWRRRDANPNQKGIVVTDSSGRVLDNVTTPVVTQHQGVVVFTPSASGSSSSSSSSGGGSSSASGGAQTYYVYYMPYTQSGIGGAKFAWDPPTVGPNHWSPVTNVSTVQKGVKTRQVFALPKPVQGRRFRWTTTQAWGGFQAFLVELEFRTSNGWLPNHATSTNHTPVIAASSWQPEGTSKMSGEPWTAMDGDVTTLWDPRDNPAGDWLELDFGKEIAIEAIGVMGCGDTTHDVKAFKFEVADSPPSGPSGPSWQQLPRANNIRLESRDEFHNIIPMGLPANASELAGMKAAYPSTDSVWLFPEPREYKVMMEDYVPFRWVEHGPSSHFNAR